MLLYNVQFNIEVFTYDFKYYCSITQGVRWTSLTGRIHTTSSIILRSYNTGSKMDKFIHNVQYNTEREREMFYLTMHSTHFIYGYMASDIWLRIILIVRKETRCHHMGYSFQLAARVLLYAPSHRQDSTYHSLCYTSREAHSENGLLTITRKCFI